MKFSHTKISRITVSTINIHCYLCRDGWHVVECAFLVCVLCQPCSVPSLHRFLLRNLLEFLVIANRSRNLWHNNVMADTECGIYSIFM